MKYFIKLYSNKNGEIKKFLHSFYFSDESFLNNLKDETLEYQISYNNPVKMSDIIAAFIDNKDFFKLNMWICLDKDVLINVTNNNANEIIKYLYERFPY